MAHDFKETDSKEKGDILFFKVCWKEVNEDTITFDTGSQALLLNLFSKTLVKDDFAMLYGLMVKCNDASELNFYLVPCVPCSGERNNVTEFVKNLYEISYKGKTYRFIPSYTLLNAIFAYKNRDKVTSAEAIPNISFTTSNIENPIEQEFLKNRSNINSVLSTPLLPDVFEKACTIDGHRHTPLQYLYHQFEKMLGSH